MAISKCLPVLKHFIGGYSLKTGAIFTGWLGLGADVLELVLSVVYFLAYGRQLPDWELLLVSAVGGCAVGGSVCGLLLYGAYKAKRSFLVPYLILGALGIISSSLVISIIGIYAVLHDFNTFAASMMLIGALIIVFLAYLWLIVFSYYQQLQKCTLLEHRGSVETVLTMPENGDVHTSHHKFLLRGKCDGAATGHIPDTKQLICDEK
ncbi:uncharacterized protein LOC110837159 isoform X2 [Zootermopsis nevadensis]|uniref:Transmembrane protein n=1 Tax=Zootermopsis nevadensis TaxID=136037 RepID=A0A067QPI0_ZOONE|nr:uncharacterized protein LOC110837159 isoform X2 [Zootermopsis nevadensis]KDR11362.1 hypothetical protein L798_14865 [Zootermopsis nevadensis]